MALTVIATSVFLFLQTAKGSIDGAVLNSVTNAPIAGAQVTATKIPGAIGVTGNQVPTGVIQAGVVGGIVSAGEGPRTAITPAKTNANGQFAFRDLEPGTYLLRASAEGYAQQEYNRPGGQGGMSASISVTTGQSVTGTVLRLTPGGTVSGRVTGANGEPLVNIEISLLRRMYDADGRRSFQQSASAQTNDRGEYRLFWVTPGQYYLSAASSNRPIPGVPFNPSAISNKYPRTFYPAARDIGSADSIDVQPAHELSGMDFRLAEQPTFRVRGRVVDARASATTPRTASISITTRDSAINGIPNSSIPLIFSTSSPYNPADGSFELRDIPSGSYLIRAQLPSNPPPQIGQPPAIPAVAIAAVDVSGADVDGVVLTFVPPVTISGRVTIEGDGSPQSLAATVILRPASTGPVFGSIPRPTQTNADGTFSIDGILPGEYRVTVNGPFTASQANTYVKDMRLGSMDLRVQPLVISGAVSDRIEVILGKDAGQISGTVRSDSQQPAPGVQIVLIPSERARHDLFKFTLSNPAGQFTFRSVPPGSYKVFAWEMIEQNSWMDPAVLSRYESLGVPAVMNSSSNVTLDLKVISSVH